MIDVVIVGAPQELVDAIKEQLEKAGRADINVTSKDTQGVVEFLDSIAQGDDGDACDCPLCEMAKPVNGRSAFVHPDIVMDEEGYVKDKVRHRLFKGPRGDVFFFDELFHPMHELNLFSTECERGAQTIYSCTPVLDVDGNQLWHVMDWSQGREIDLDHVGGILENQRSRQETKISMISGPYYEMVKAEKLSKAH